MYDLPVSVEELNNKDKIHVILVDFLLREAINKLDTSNQYWRECKDERIYIYLIQSNDHRWRVTLFPIELSVDETAYKYRAVTDLTISDLIELTQKKDMRYELIKRLLPANNTSSAVNYFDFKKQYSRELN